MLNTTNISALLRWAMENIGYPIDEINTLDGTVNIRQSDGRTGYLYKRPGLGRWDFLQ